MKELSVNDARAQLPALIRLGKPIIVNRRYAGKVALIVPKNVSRSALLKAWEEMQK